MVFGGPWSDLVTREIVKTSFALVVPVNRKLVESHGRGKGVRNVECDATRLTLVALSHRVGWCRDCQEEIGCCRGFSHTVLGKTRLNATQVSAERSFEDSKTLSSYDVRVEM